MIKKIIIAALVAITVGCSERPEITIDVIAENYVEVVLATGNYDPVYVDAYYGPESIKTKVDEQQWTLEEISIRAGELTDKINAIAAKDDEEKIRLHYLKTQLRAVMFHIEHLINKNSGQPYERNFDNETKALYDTIIPKRELAEFDAILAELDAIVPGEGDLVERVTAFTELLEIPPEKVDAVFTAAMDECRKRTLQFVSLPEDENFVVEYVNDQPWSGYNWYQGNAFSLIQVNMDFPISISRAVDLGCHEGYPGHHTYNALLETELAHKKGYIELTVYPLFSPQSLIAEGSANYGIEMAFPGEEKAAFEQEILYPMAGLDAANQEIYNQIVELRRDLTFARNEIARQYIEGDISREEAIVLQSKFGLEKLDKAEQRIAFVDKYGAYVINYNWGKQLVREFIEQGNPSHEERWQRFETLLSSPRLPSSIDW